MADRPRAVQSRDPALALRPTALAGATRARLEGNFTCVVARFAAARGASGRETLHELEHRAVKELLPADVATLRRLRRSALSCVSVAEVEYSAVRGFRACVVPSCKGAA